MKVKIGIIGCGVIAQHHIRSAQKLDGCEIATVCDVREDVAKKTAETFGIAKVETDAAQVLADPEIDAVVLALPTSLRHQLALDALAAGKHVLTEKPAAMNAQEVVRLAEAQGDRVLACCSNRLSEYPNVKAAAAHVAAGKLGPLRTIHCRAVIQPGKPPETPPPAWRLKKAANGGGILMNWCVYDLDFLFSMVGWDWEPAWVLAQTWRMPGLLEAHQAPGSDAETEVLALVRFTNGVMLSLNRAERFPGRTEQGWSIIGEKGSLRMHLLQPGDPVIFDEIVPEEGIVSREIFQEDASVSTQNGVPLRDFIGAILERRPPHTGMRESLLLARLFDAIYESVETGQPVQVEPCPYPETAASR